MDKVAIITGSTNELSYAVVNRFAKEGYKVAACNIFIDLEKYSINDKIKEKIEFYEFDITNEIECKNYIDTIFNKWGKIDVLCNLEEELGEFSNFFNIDFSAMKHTMNVNLIGTLNMCKYVSQYMISQKHGTIINASSICGEICTSNNLVYHASKNAINSVTKVMGYDLGPFNVRCLSVSLPDVSKDKKLYMSNSYPNFNDLANIFYSLALEEMKVINGSIVKADDGYTSFKVINEG